MNPDDRPNPEELLKAIKREENKTNKGHLKIFLGMAAGVGKTFAMLKAAQKQKEEKVDIVVGSIYTHGRKETAAMLVGLEMIPEKWIKYKDSVFEELDLDGVISRKPQLVLVDELAHSNVPGSRHPKRWQDIVEILDNGIDVYTTLNVQHIESLKDIIEGITESPIRENVPDSIIQTAAHIEIVDITTEELLKRLRQGKVYLGGQSAIAARHFFQEDRLMALREIVLRYGAEKIDHDLHEMISMVERGNSWKPRERLLVALSHSPHSQKLIRTTRRLASNLDAPWIALHVNEGKILDEADSAMLAKNLALARELGAEVITTNDPDVCAGIQRIALQKGVTQIIIGRSPKNFLYDFFPGFSLLYRLVKACSEIDIHVIRQEYEDAKKKYLFSFHLRDMQVFPYIFMFCLVWFLTGMNWLAFPIIGYKVIGFIYLLTILILSLFFKKGPIFFASVMCALIWDFCFIPPVGTLLIGSKDDGALVILYFLTAIVTGILTDRTREHKEMLLKREESAQILYEIVQEIATAPSLKDLLKSIQTRLGGVLKGSCEIFIKRLDVGLVFDESVLLQNENERQAALWVFDNKEEAGWSTSTLLSAKCLFIPLKGAKEVVGILAFKPNKSRGAFSLEEKNFFYTVAHQLANYFERSLLEERKRHIEQLSQIEKIHQTFFKQWQRDLHILLRPSTRPFKI